MPVTRRLLHSLETLSGQENALIDAGDWPALDELLDRQIAVTRGLVAHLPRRREPATSADALLRARLRQFHDGCVARVRQLAAIAAADKNSLHALETLHRQLCAVKQSYINRPRSGSPARAGLAVHA